MAAMATGGQETVRLLEQTIEALSVFDADRLEWLALEATAFAARRKTFRSEELKSDAQTVAKDPQQIAGTIHVAALKNTLCELLRTTDANLRLLRQLREMRVMGLADDAYGHPSGGARWVR